MFDRAKRIREAIEQSGYSYAELSEITGVSKSSLQRYATGQTKKIPISCIEKIAEATKTDARYLMGWEDPKAKKNAPAEEDSESVKKLKEIIEKISQLSDSDLIQLDNFVSFLVAQSKGKTEE